MTKVPWGWLDENDVMQYELVDVSRPKSGSELTQNLWDIVERIQRLKHHEITKLFGYFAERLPYHVLAEAFDALVAKDVAGAQKLWKSSLGRKGGKRNASGDSGFLKVLDIGIAFAEFEGRVMSARPDVGHELKSAERKHGRKLTLSEISLIIINAQEQEPELRLLTSTRAFKEATGRPESASTIQRSLREWQKLPAGVRELYIINASRAKPVKPAKKSTRKTAKKVATKRTK